MDEVYINEEETFKVVVLDGVANVYQRTDTDSEWVREPDKELKRVFSGLEE